MATQAQLTSAAEIGYALFVGFSFVPVIFRFRIQSDSLIETTTVETVQDLPSGLRYLPRLPGLSAYLGKDKLDTIQAYSMFGTPLCSLTGFFYVHGESAA